MGKLKGIAKTLESGVKMVGIALPALTAIFGLSLMCVSCSVVTPQEEIYKSYRETEYFKEVYMEDVTAATNAFNEGYITNSEYRSRMDRYDSDAYLKEKIMEDTEHPEYREAVEKCNDGFKYLAIGAPMMFIAGIGSTFFYMHKGSDAVASAVNDFKDAKKEFAKKSGSGPKPKKPVNKKPAKKVSIKKEKNEEEDLPSIEDTYYKY